MTEFETATLAVQQAALAIQQAALWRSDISTALTAAIGLGQCFLIWWGIRKMATQGAKREEQHADRHAETMEVLRQQGEAAKAQHAETMEVLRQQGESFRQQGEALRQQGEAFRQQGEALRQQSEALRAIIDRMAPTTGQ